MEIESRGHKDERDRFFRVLNVGTGYCSKNRFKDHPSGHTMQSECGYGCEWIRDGATDANCPLEHRIRFRARKPCGCTAKPMTILKALLKDTSTDSLGENGFVGKLKENIKNNLPLLGLVKDDVQKKDLDDMKSSIGVILDVIFNGREVEDILMELLKLAPDLVDSLYEMIKGVAELALDVDFTKLLEIFTTKKNISWWKFSLVKCAKWIGVNGTIRKKIMKKLKGKIKSMKDSLKNAISYNQRIRNLNPYGPNGLAHASKIINRNRKRRNSNPRKPEGDSRKAFESWRDQERPSSSTAPRVRTRYPPMNERTNVTEQYRQQPRRQRQRKSRGQRNPQEQYQSQSNVTPQSSSFEPESSPNSGPAEMAPRGVRSRQSTSLKQLSSKEEEKMILAGVKNWYSGDLSNLKECPNCNGEKEIVESSWLGYSTTTICSGLSGCGGKGYVIKLTQRRRLNAITSRHSVSHGLFSYEASRENVSYRRRRLASSNCDDCDGSGRSELELFRDSLKHLHQIRRRCLAAVAPITSRFAVAHKIRKWDGVRRIGRTAAEILGEGSQRIPRRLAALMTEIEASTQN